jgi:hypothetical protein
MSRKKTTEVQPEAPPAALPVETQTATLPAPPPPPAQGNGARGPDVRWSIQSDKSTLIAVECFVNSYVHRNGEGYEQVHTVVTRSFLGQDGKWVRHQNWRTHDIPILLFLLAKAHAYALERRTDDSSMPF